MSKTSDKKKLSKQGLKKIWQFAKEKAQEETWQENTSESADSKEMVHLPDHQGEWILPEKGDDAAIENENEDENFEEKKSSEKPSDLYSAFVQHATNVPRLSEEEEYELGLKVKNHKDDKAAKKLVLHNLRLAIKMAHQYRRSWTNLMDLVQEAAAGMAIAANRWDPDMKTRYGTYAAYWIRAQLTKFLMTNGRLIHTANTRAGRKIYFSLPGIRRQLVAKGETPTVEKIAKEAGEDPKEVQLILSRLESKETSLQTLVSDSSATTLQDALESNEKNPEVINSQLQMKKVVNDLVLGFEKKITNKRDLTLWKEHLTSASPTSLVELGKRYGVSKQRMGQLTTRLKRSFRRHVIDTLGPNTQLSWLFDE